MNRRHFLQISMVPRIAVSLGATKESLAIRQSSTKARPAKDRIFFGYAPISSDMTRSTLLATITFEHLTSTGVLRQEQHLSTPTVSRRFARQAGQASQRASVRV